MRECPQRPWAGSPYPAVHSWQSSSKSNDRPSHMLTPCLVAPTVFGLSLMPALAQNAPGGAAAARHAGFDIEAHRGGRALRPAHTLHTFANGPSAGVELHMLAI